jgi:hypothetical protein
MNNFKETLIYVKICNHCGLKYFGKSSRGKYYVKNTYKGSGKKWKRHYKYHNSKITTFIINYFDEIQKTECKDFCKWFSKINNIVKSNKWANLKMENGLDGGDYWSGKTLSKEHKNNLSITRQGEKNHFYNKKHIEESLKMMRDAKLGKKQSKETIAKRVAKNKGKKRTNETKLQMSLSAKAHTKSKEHQRKLDEINKNRKNKKTGTIKILENKTKNYKFCYRINSKNYVKSFKTLREATLAQKWYKLLFYIIET